MATRRSTQFRYTAAADPRDAYEASEADCNAAPNAADLLFLSGSCYGGVVRFRAADGFMSTPMGAHKPVSPESFAARAKVWRERTAGATFRHLDYREALDLAQPGDAVGCRW
jgi:DNA adenine methylase